MDRLVEALSMETGNTAAEKIARGGVDHGATQAFPSAAFPLPVVRLPASDVCYAAWALRQPSALRRSMRAMFQALISRR